MALPEARQLTRKQVAQTLGVGVPTLRKIILATTFPKPDRAGKWSAWEVEQWAAVPRCTYGPTGGECWQEADPEGDKYGLGMCRKHREKAEQALTKQRRNRKGARPGGTYA